MKHIYSYAAMVALALGTAACSSESELVTPDNSQEQTVSNVITLAPQRASQVNMYSNNPRRSMAAQAVVTVEDISKTGLFPTDEISAVTSVLGEGSDNSSKLNTDFLYYSEEDVTIELYTLTGQTNQTHEIGVFYYDANGQMQKVVAWDGLTYGGQWNTNTITWGNWTWDAEKNASVQVNTYAGKKITIKKGYKFGFYWNGIDNNGQATTYYSESSLNEELPVYGGSGTSKLHAGTFEQDGKLYLGIEDWHDFDFQDVVFSLTTEDVKIVEPDFEPEDDDDPVTPVDPVTPDPVDPDPVDSIVSENGGSIEVNLAINEEHEQGDWKESHLSIHVRDTSDVIVFLPVEAEYYCDQDDFMIVQKHDIAYQYAEKTETVSMNIGEAGSVKVTITHKAEGIYVETQGITADILKYLRETYNDGLTIEVRNYYNDAITRPELLEKLNQSTIEFVNPTKTYVNAYGVWNDIEDPLACKVTPTDKANREEPQDRVASAHEKANLYIWPLKQD